MGCFTRLLCAVFLLRASNGDIDVPCIRSFTPQGEAAAGFISEVDMTWLEVQERCPVEHPGYWMLMRYEYFSSYELGLCPDGSLVPIGIIREGKDLRWNSLDNLYKQILSQEELHKFKDPDLTVTGMWGAIRWPYGGLVLVGPETKFRCGVCTIFDRSKVITHPVYPPHNNSIYAYDLELVSDDRVDDIGVLGNGTDLTNRLLADLAESFNIPVEALRWHGAEPNEDLKAVVHVYYKPGFDNMDWVHYVHWNDVNAKRKTVKGFDITLIKLNTECLLSDKEQLRIKQETALTGTIDYTFNMSTMSITARECYWNGLPGIERANWSRFITWKVNWKPCTAEDFVNPATAHGQDFTNALKNIDVACAFQLMKYVDQTDTNLSLPYPIAGVKLFLSLHNMGSINSAFAILSSSILQNLAQVFIRAQLSYDKPTEMISSKFVNVLASNQLGDNPVIGMAVMLPSSENRNKFSVNQLNHADSNASLAKNHVVVTVSKSIAFTAKRLAIATYATHSDLPSLLAPIDKLIKGWLSIVQVTFARNSSHEDDVQGDYVDIAFNATFRQAKLKGKCAERVFATDEWYGGNCAILRSMREALTVCRCKNIPKESNITNGVYLIYGFDANFSSYLASNSNLVIVMVFVCLMSALGLLSVILTTILFPKWRKDQGHQIFLQMIFALAVNLLIGFINSFVKIDTKSAACIVIGVVRHYSFLAMFFWMMILSALQIKRLTTISGTKATTHLLLKVSLIAWGLPMIPIITLLVWNTGFYKSEISDRGYCFPEGLAFQLTVQAPAGAILVINMLIFLVILNHIYGWCKCGKTMEVRKHTDDRAEQLRRLSTSIFIFFLFGFTWLFHFLSEEGVINSEFLFEFMFLITASFHLFMLSLFFIVLDKNTRSLWVNGFTSVQAPWRPKKELVRKKVIAGKQGRKVKAPEVQARRARAVRVKRPPVQSVSLRVVSASEVSFEDSSV